MTASASCSMTDNEVGEKLLAADEHCRLCVWVRMDDVCHRCGNDALPNDEYFHAASAAEYAAGQATYRGRRRWAAEAPPCPRFVRRQQA